MAKPTSEPPSTQIAVRFPNELVAAVDALAAEMSRPGLVATRSDAVRVLVVEALAARTKEEAKAARKPRR